MNDLIRCIDTKTGKEKFLPPNVVKDKKHMAAYNLIVQDLKEDKKKVDKIIEDPKEVVSELIEDSGNQSEEFEQVEVESETTEAKPKRGPKTKVK